MKPASLLLAAASIAIAASPDAVREYDRRVKAVKNTPGFVALWDFVHQQDGRFAAHQPASSKFDFRLDAVNYIRDYWSQGRSAVYADFPLLGRGPFGQAIRIQREDAVDFRPVLLVPRERSHNSRLDVKGPGRSVSMVVWIVRENGNHAIAGIWHEGTDLNPDTSQVQRREQGRRQYALFAGLAANNGASAAHVSENGAASFGDKYARNLSTTRQVIPAGQDWSVAGFVFDNDRDIVTSYLDGVADDFWIEQPEKHPFFQWPARAWSQGQLPEPAPGFPRDQTYRPPETRPLSKQLLEQIGDTRTELHTYPFTKVRVTYMKDAAGRFTKVTGRELAALKVNPFWFGHDLYNPVRPSEGGPFTIGRVIHTSRSQGFLGWIGGVAVFDRALSPAAMKRLANIGRKQQELTLLHAGDLK